MAHSQHSKSTEENILGNIRYSLKQTIEEPVECMQVFPQVIKTEAVNTEE
jgi:hypothetical protein